MELHIQLRDGGETAFAKYGQFGVADATDKFRLSVGEYSQYSTAGDSLLYHNGAQWSTFDEDNDLTNRWNCPVKCHGPNWSKSCTRSNPLGEYLNHNHC